MSASGSFPGSLYSIFARNAGQDYDWKLSRCEQGVGLRMTAHLIGFRYKAVCYG